MPLAKRLDNATFPLAVVNQADLPGETESFDTSPLSVTTDGDLRVAITGGVIVGSAVTVSNFPAVQPVSDNAGSLTVDDGGGSLTVDGSVAVSNFPATYPVTDNGGSLTVDGSVAVSNFPAVQPVDDNGGSLTVDGTVGVSNFPASYPVTDNAGSLTVDDGGGSLTVDGTVAVSNFPVTQAVSDGASSLTVDDGGGSLTIDGAVTISGGTITATIPSLEKSAFGDLVAVNPTPVAAWRFDYGVNTRIVNKTETNGGTVTQDGNRAKLSTGTNTAGLARIETIRLLRYLPGVGARVTYTAVFATPVANSTQYIGVGDTLDRLFFGYSGTTFVVGRRRNGAADSLVPQVSWNGSTPSFTQTNGNIYRVKFQWLGYGFLRFYIVDPSNQANGFSLVHAINYPNTSPDVHLYNPTLPIFAEVANTGNNTDVVMYTPSAVAEIEGNPGGGSVHPLDIPNTQDNTATFSDTNNNHLLSIQNKSTFGGVANRVPVSIRRITLSRSSAGAALCTVRIYTGTVTTAGARVYTDQDASNSPVSYSTTTTTITAGTAERSYSLSTNVTNLPPLDFKPGELVIYPGQIMTIGWQDSQNNATDAVVTVDWAEEF